MAQPRHITIKPTMGVASDTYKLLVNVVPRKGVLERRPALRAVSLGRSVFKGSYTTPDPAGFEAGVGDDPDYAGKFDLYSSDFQSNHVIEGIDVEIVAGKVLALYVGRAINSSTATEYELSYSWHWPTDLAIGREVEGETIFDHGSLVDFPVLIADRERFRFGIYETARYWDRRILKVLGGFMFTGRGVGWGMTEDLSAGAAPGPVDELAFHDATPMRMMGAPTLLSTIPRVDPFNTLYVTRGPKSAFGHVDRLGQVVWYGFTNGDPYEIDSAVPAASTLAQALELYLSEDRTTVNVFDFDVWYSEANMPVSLPIVGLVPILNGTKAPAVVGLAEYQSGTILFTTDSIQFLRGVGADEKDLSRVVIHQGVGSDSRWSIKKVGQGVAFVNKSGLNFLGQDGQVHKIRGFDSLFDGGVEAARHPYDQHFTDTVPATGVPASGEIGKLQYEDAYSGAEGVFDPAIIRSYDALPWRNYKVDLTRLDRAVGMVWDDLYLCAVSQVGDDLGDDNRLVLVWNWKENTSSVWLLPRNMGIRGFAYDGSLSQPYVMTRYGLAMFEGSSQRDRVWEHNTTAYGGAIVSIGPDLAPVTRDPWPAVLGLTHHLPESGDAFTVSDVVVQHETSLDDTLDDDYKFRFQLWSSINEINIGRLATAGQDSNSITTSDNPALPPSFSSVVKAWRKEGDPDTGESHGKSPHATAALSVGQAIRKASTARSGWSAIRHRVQWHTLSPGRIFSMQVGLVEQARRGTRSGS